MKNVLTRRNWLFSANTFIAGMAALWIALSMGLPMPTWAMMTAYIVSQPLSGAMRSRGIYRLAGSVLAAIAVLVLVPRLVQAPVLLCLALALWVAACVYLSYLDRTPRSYLFALAGYTAAVIAFPAVGTPETIFDTAVDRVLEICIGLVCATVVHGIVFPRPVAPVLIERIDVFLRDARTWALDALAGNPSRRDWRKLAADVEELRILSTHLPYDNARLRPTSPVVRALQERLSQLLPVLSSIEDRLAALRDEGPLPTGLLDEMAAWIPTGDPARAEELRAACLAIVPEVDARSPWRDLLLANLAERLRELIETLRDCNALRDTIGNPVGRIPEHVAPLVRARAFRPLHRDHGMAALSALAALVAILGTCAFWIATAWPHGGTAAMIAAIFTSLFATRDDPAPQIFTELAANSLAFVVAGVYLFAILPRVTGFPMLALVLAPVLLLTGAFMSKPGWVGRATPFTLGLMVTLSLQQSFRPDFARFANLSIAQAFGFLAAGLTTVFVRSVRADWLAMRILRTGWRDLARVAEPGARPDRVRWLGRMLDRLGLLAPRLAGVTPGDDPEAADALRDLRIGLNLVDLQLGVRSLPTPAVGPAARLLRGLALHFGARARGGSARLAPDLLAAIDDALANGAGAHPATLRALVGLRRGLFPAAPPYRPPLEEAS